MKRLRVFLIFVLFFLVAGGPAYAQSLEDKPAEGPKTKEEVQVQAPEEKKEVIQEKSVPEGKEIGADQAKLTKEEEVQENSSSDKLEDGEKKELEDQESDQATYPDSGEKEGPEEKAQEEKTEGKNQKAGLPKDKKKASPDQVQDQEEAGQVLEKGQVLDPQALKAGNPQDQGESKVYEVKDFEGLKAAINDPGFKNKTIRITQGFEITETLTIGQGQKVILTSNNGQEMDKPWEKIDQPKDYANEGEKKQREVIEKARKRGDKAIEEAKENIKKENSDYYYDFQTDLVLKRGDKFTGTMFDVQGDLTLGDENNSIHFDGNKKLGTFFTVQNKSQLTLKNGVIANGKNEIAGHAPVEIKDGGAFIMKGGRITANEIVEDSKQFSLNAGGVYVSPGGKFTMTNGMIDHNTGAAGGVFAGDLFGAQGKDLVKNPEEAAIVELNGGSIVSNKTRGGRQLAGGVAVFPGGTLNFNDGIIANNLGNTRAGGIFVTDQYITDSDDEVERKSTTPGPYDEHIRVNKAEASLKGGLIYKNITPERGGGVFVDSNRVSFERVMILNNKATVYGGGIYVSYAPRTQKLENILITENHAVKGGSVSGGLDGIPATGGGIWNCPYGSTHIGDGHSIYVYNNTSVLNKGSDYSYPIRNYPFSLNGKRVEDQFYLFLSPITKDHNFIEFLNDDGSGNLIPKNMSYTNHSTLLKAVYNEALKAEAWRNAGTFILGNEASGGGGYAGNANTYTPKDQGDIEFYFKKKWDEKIDKSDYANKDIHVDIFIVPLDKDEVYVRSQYGQDPDLYKYGEVVLNQGNNWQASFSKNAYSNYTLTKDKGLPFTKEELKKMGYKYLVMERETGYATSVEEKNAEAPLRPGTVVITRDKSRAYGSADQGNGNADFYFYEVNKDGTLSYIGKSTKNGENAINAEFSHEIFSGDIKAVVPYGKDRNLIEKEAGWNGWKGYSENAGRYSIFVEKIEDGIVLHVPYIWTQKGDGRYGESSGIKVVKKEAGPVERKDFYGYEFTISNRPFAEAKIKKTWKLLNGDQDNGGLDNGKIPDQVSFYILKDGQRIIVDYKRNENGKVHPIYKMVTLTKKEGWQGLIKELDPKLLERAAYGLEEEALEGFKMSYTFKKALVDPREKKDDKEDDVKIQFRLSREYVFFSAFSPTYIVKQAGYIPQDENKIKDGNGFKNWLGEVTVRLIVDGHVREEKKMTWKPRRNRYGGIDYVLDDENLLFGYDEKKPIVVNSGGHNIKVRYYNSMDSKWGYHDAGNPSVNLYLKKDEKGIYSLYVPNILIEGNFAKVFKVTEKDIEGIGKMAKYPEITDFNPNAKNLEPYYEYIFLVTNTELPPERPPHEPPEEPEEPPVSPPEEPEEPPVIPPEKPEQPGEPPRKPGAPRTGIESLAPYFILAMTSSLGLGYFSGKKD